MRGILVFTLLCGVCQAQSQTAPQYSNEARIAGLEGKVVVEGVVKSDGSTADLHITRHLGLGLDERAIQAVSQWRFDAPSDGPTSWDVDFTLPEKRSHWHLVGVEFQAPAGVTRPTFAQADYPVGPGIGVAAYDEAQLLNVIGRGARVTLAFDINERGDPGNFKVVNASADIWGPQAAILVRTWRFFPGMKAGMPAAVPCTVTLVWGPEEFQSKAVISQVTQLYSPPPELPRNQPAVAATILVRKEPEYTEEARHAGVEGSVTFDVVVGPDGVPARVTHMDAPLAAQGDGAGAALVQNAENTLRQWRFQPPMLNGQPKSISISVRVNFRLAGVDSAVYRQGVTVPIAAKVQH